MRDSKLVADREARAARGRTAHLEQELSFYQAQSASAMVRQFLFFELLFSEVAQQHGRSLWLVLLHRGQGSGAVPSNTTCAEPLPHIQSAAVCCPTVGLLHVQSASQPAGVKSLRPLSAGRPRHGRLGGGAASESQRRAGSKTAGVTE